MESKKSKQLKINPYVLVILSFALMILIGSVLLNMPFARIDTNKWDWNNYLDSFYTACSATCVTGTCTFKDGFAGTMSLAGQIITIILIQIGGLGFITVLTFIITLFKTKLQFKDRYFISQMVSSTNFADVVKFVRNIILISFIVEFIGTLLGLPVFIYMFPDNIGMAIWYSIFHSISAFNNAGFDLFSNTASLVDGLKAAGTSVFIPATDWRYYYFCSYLMVLIILGGISFLVIINVVTKGKRVHQWNAFTKICILMGVILHVGGTLLIYLADGFKGSHNITLFNALFQSITCRTAGFSTYWQDNLSIGSKVTSCLLMIIGGAPLGTAGGLKTTTFFMVFLAFISHFRGSKVHAFKRSYSNSMVVKAMSLLTLGLLFIIASFVCLNYFGLEKGVTLDSLEFEVGGEMVKLKSDLSLLYFYAICSNFGTVGLGVGFEPFLSVGSKITLTILMFLGRLGPMTFLQIFQNNMDKDVIQNFEYIEEDFLIG